MHTRDYVKSVFADEGLYKLINAKMATLLRSIDDAPADCWPEFIQRFRDEQYDLFDQIVPPLLFGKDRLVRTILARAIDPQKKKEMQIAEVFIEKADAAENEPELLALVDKKDKRLTAEILKKPGLSKTLKSRIDLNAKLAAIAGKKKQPKPAIEAVKKQMSDNTGAGKKVSSKKTKSKKITGKKKTSKKPLKKTPANRR